ncbi:MAG: 16S rRNA (cytosine(967)-C(5))-methyltransferase RsmB [Gammaproteobacteria bacterium]|nr:16S rRNA (cytosine(967)-C(5))-methyltransferase RsmB [Gammaproteobacteria bacterium]
MAEPGGRAAAARVLVDVLDHGRSLATALPFHSGRVVAAERGLAQEISYGSLRWYPRLATVLAALVTKPLKPRDRVIHGLLIGGLYQLAYLDMPPHLAVSRTVEATLELDKAWAKGLVNGVLRRFQRESAALLARADRDEASALAHPAWLIDHLRQAWPDHWQTIIEANNQRPPMTLRVNLARRSREEYLDLLRSAGLDARPSPHAPAALTLAEPVPVERLPGFAAGEVSVQDAAAQLAAPLLQLESGQHVLDACAAPGGKTSHILETAGLTVDALDKDEARLTRVQETLARLGGEARLLAADAAVPEAWWDGRPYDRILLDAPCSATGVIRRHPDIKLLRRADDIPTLVAEQQRLLAAVWPLLKRGGMLVYATCSVLPEENARQITRFIAEQSDARPLPIAAHWGREAAPGRQVLPGEDEMDGFYYARIAKI